MEPNTNPLVPDSPNPPETPRPLSSPPLNQPGSTPPQLTNSSFQSRTINPLAPTPAPDTAQLDNFSSIPEQEPVAVGGLTAVSPNFDSLTDAPAAAPAPPPSPYTQPAAPAPAPLAASPPSETTPLAPPSSPAQLVPPAPPPAPFQPQAPVVSSAFVGNDGVIDNGHAFTPTMPVAGSPPKRKFNFKSKPALAGYAAILLGLIFAGYYFGYKTNPNVIYSQALSNTGKGYDKLIEYVDARSKVKYKGSIGTGSFKIKSGGSSTDGNIAIRSDDKNGELTFDVGVGGSRVSADIRMIESSAGSPDFYLQASGLKGLGSLAGLSELDSPLAKLDGAWIVIDHTLVDSLGLNQSSDPSQSTPNQEQILDAAKSFGEINKQYLFTTDKDKAVLKIVEKVGAETVNDHKTYHYKMALDKDNVKSYIDAQKAALKSSKLWGWIQENNYEDTVTSTFDDMKTSAETIKESDTFDMWADSGTRLIYKVRFAEKANSAANFVDLGLDYKGGDDFPFFLSGENKQDTDKITYKMVISLNTKTNGVAFSFDAEATGYTEGTLSMKINFKPSSQTVKVDKPTGAKSLARVLSELGYGDLLSQLQAYTASSTGSGGAAAGIQEKARNSERSVDIKSLQVQIEVFYSAYGYYPSLKDMNSSSWLKANMKSLDREALIDPSNPSRSSKLASAPAAKVYSYAVLNSAGKSCESNDTTCSKYTLTATYEGTINNSKVISVTNLDGS